MGNKNDIFTKHGHCHPHCGHSEFLVTDNLLGEFQFMTEAERQIARDNLGIVDCDHKPLTVNVSVNDEDTKSVSYDGSVVKNVRLYSSDGSVIFSVEDGKKEFAIDLKANSCDCSFEKILAMIHENGYYLPTDEEWQKLQSTLSEYNSAIRGIEEEIEDINGDIENIKEEIESIKRSPRFGQ